MSWTPAVPTRRPLVATCLTLPLTALVLLPLLGLADPGPAAPRSVQPYEGPIIDMHLHAYTPESYWGAVPHPATGEPAPATAEEHRAATLEVMDRHGVVLGAVSSDALAAAEAWAERAPGRFLKGIAVHDPLEDLDADEFAGWVEDGRLEVFAEIGAQYGGYSPSDPAFDPYWSVAEAHGIPVGIHTGESFPGTPYDACCPDFRLRLGDPLLLEEMLVAHPDLKVFVMHAGGFAYERALQLMQMYPHVHAEVGVLGHVPEHRGAETLARFLRGAKARGYLDRVMFGSDQMVWPEAIALSIDAVQSLDFLTVEEKRAIFYGNAARFLGLSEEERARHHAM